MKSSNHLTRIVRLFSLIFLLSSALAEQEMVISEGKSYQVIDNVDLPDADGHYDEPDTMGGQDGGGVDSWGDDRRWGDGLVSATWSFLGLEDGEYAVYASWRNAAQGNVGPATYTGSDGFKDTLEDSAESVLDQSVGASAVEQREVVTLSDGLQDISFQQLGNATVSDGTFVLTLRDKSDPADSPDGVFVFADAVAIRLKSAVADADSDGDGMLDAWELEFGLDKDDPADAASDLDGDELSNRAEFANGTLPNDEDSDSDTLTDGFEVNTFNSNPLLKDSDQDGLDDAAERIAGTQPKNPDSDGDGASDKTEVDTGTDPTIHGLIKINTGETEYLIIDNLAANETGESYEEPGGFDGEDLNRPDSWGGDRRWGNLSGSATESTWTFVDLASGTYDVYVSWRTVEQLNLSEEALYIISDGGGEVIVNQREGTGAKEDVIELTDAAGRAVTFAPLGSAEVGDGELIVTLNDDEVSDTTTFVFADAIALVQTGGSLTPFFVNEVGYHAETSMVNLTWNSKPNRGYMLGYSPDLSPGSWQILNDSVVTGGDTTNLAFDLSTALNPVPTQAFFRVTEGPPPPLFSENFENGAEGWSGELPWEVGIPAVEGLNAAHGGTNVYGTDLDGPVGAGVGANLRSPIIDLTGVSRPKLSFWYYVDTTEGTEGVQLNILTESGAPFNPPLTVEEIFWGKSADWTPFNLTIPEAAREQKVVIEWRLLTDDGGEAGFYLDDVEVD